MGDDLSTALVVDDGSGRRLGFGLGVVVGVGPACVGSDDVPAAAF